MHWLSDSPFSTQTLHIRALAGKLDLFHKINHHNILSSSSANPGTQPDMAPKEQGPEDEYWSQWPRCTTCCTHHPAQEHLPALTTMHDVQQEYTAIEASWRKSDCRPRFHDMLTSKRPPSGWQITEAISLGIGSFTEYSCGLFDRRCSMMQFIVFMDTVRFLEAGNVTGATIEISSQDPRYMDLDRDFLRSLGVVVLERPEAEERIKKASFTYMPRVCDAQVLIKSQPALHIGWGITSGIRQNERFFHEDE